MLIDEGPGERGPRVSEAAGSPLAIFAEDQIAAFGRRRTAYPLDLTLEEVVRRRIAISTRIARIPVSRRSAFVSLKGIARRLAASRSSAVLLGQPGSGKSMAIYRLAKECESCGLLPILLRVTDVERYSHELSPLLVSGNAHENVVLLLDGLDEGMAVWRRSRTSPNLIVRLMASVPTLATSRTRDFEESSQLDNAGITFEDIFELQPWSVEAEFHRYVTRLSRIGAQNSDELFVRVERSVELRRIASRPLHARMLAFIFESNPHASPSDPGELYAEYIQRLARVATIGLERRGCTIPGGVLQFWKEMAWQLYRVTSGRYSVNSLIGRAGDGAVSAGCGRAAIDFIADRVDVDGYDSVEFLHYSFFEWLVAARIHDVLSSPELTDESASGLLSSDLPREIRHHLRAQLWPMKQTLSSRLARAYKAMRSHATDPRRALIAGNLIVYLIARSSMNAEKILTGFLRDEQEPFLANSILWSLTHRGSRTALDQFMDRYGSSEDWRKISRGYVLYYYGDIPNELGPPYRDIPPYVSADRTITQVLSMLENPAYAANVAIERQSIDLLTILDILRVRNISMAGRQIQVIFSTMSRFESELNSHDAARVLISEAISDVTSGKE